MHCPICNALEIAWYDALEKVKGKLELTRIRIHRVYRCGKCGHVWRQLMPSEIYEDHRKLK